MGIIGLLLSTVGILLMVIGLIMFFLQRRQQRNELVQAEKISKHLREARLVKRDLEQILEAAAQTAEEMVSRLHQEVSIARATIDKFEEKRAGLHGESKYHFGAENKNAAVINQKADKPSPRPFYIQEYLQHQGGHGNSLPNYASGPLARGKEFIKSLRQGEPCDWTKGRCYEQILPLQKLGLNDGEIAQVLGLGKGEVQLVTRLRRRA